MKRGTKRFTIGTNRKICLYLRVSALTKCEMKG